MFQRHLPDSEIFLMTPWRVSKRKKECFKSVNISMLLLENIWGSANPEIKDCCRPIYVTCLPGWSRKVMLMTATEIWTYPLRKAELTDSPHLQHQITTGSETSLSLLLVTINMSESEREGKILAAFLQMRKHRRAESQVWSRSWLFKAL